MFWNNNDTKYILKRFISYLLIFLFLFLFSTLKANALTQTNYIAKDDIGLTSGFTIGINYIYIPKNATGTNYEPFNNLGNVEGTLIFTTVFTANDTSGQAPVFDVEIRADGLYICEQGNQTTYWNNTEQVWVNTYKCPVKFSSSHGLHSINFKRPVLQGLNSITAHVSMLATFISKDSTSVTVNQQQVVNAINQSQQDMITAMQNSNQAIIDSAHADAQQAHQDSQAIQNTLTNDNVDGANGDLDNFKNNSTFSDSTGLQAVLELPLNLVSSFNNSCSPISITIPWLNYTGSIPCMSTIYRSHFNSLFNIVSLIVNAFFIYRLLLKVYELVHTAKQPDEAKLEVIDL